MKRHYKKDSRYVNDLYTLTYDNHESLDTVELISSLYFRTDFDDNVSVFQRLLHLNSVQILTIDFQNWVSLQLFHLLFLHN